MLTMEKVRNESRVQSYFDTSFTPPRSRCCDPEPKGWSWRTPLLLAMTAVASIAGTAAMMRPELAADSWGRLKEATAATIAAVPAKPCDLGMCKAVTEPQQFTRQATLSRPEQSPGYRRGPQPHHETDQPQAQASRELQEILRQQAIWLREHPVVCNCQ